jgi:transposase
VVDEERSISKSAKKLGIKLSTAKLIIKKYKESGSFFEKKKDRENREKAE